ncbi:ABC transporter substrate-binding protein [Nocardioides immobilis]|uniref:ABC transporter substrate-binding protein n=1 Tax=Nocardioides immobilis TaxID=2049295 RepID=A0A417Y2X4_9ACTN|nr:ABC transporter substrate-binding protein [Nocardioides immobilis]RHW27012.1 ABC transporter substrate-binding protein [Nocardioides immobilis]
MNKLRATAAAGLGSLLLIAASACGGTASSSDEASGAKGSFEDISAEVKPDDAAIALLPADIKEAGVITMAADLHYPPTSFLAEDQKTPIGYNVDIATLLAQVLGLEVEVKNVTWDGVIPGIAAGRYDFTATNMTPTPERLEVLDMITYWAPGSSLIVQKGNPEDLSIADESICGKKIAVMTGSSQQQDYLPLISEDCEAAGEEPVEGVNLGNVESALTQLSSKRLDGVFSDTSQLAWAAQQQPEAFELLSPQYVKEVGDDTAALGLPKDSPLTEALHAAMQVLMDSPAYQATLDRWGLGAGAISESQILR